MAGSIVCLGHTAHSHGGSNRSDERRINAGGSPMALQRDATGGISGELPKASVRASAGAADGASGFWNCAVHDRSGAVTDFEERADNSARAFWSHTLVNEWI